MFPHVVEARSRKEKTMKNEEVRLVLPPYHTDSLDNHAVRTTSEAGYRPTADGSFPMFPFEFTNWIEEELSWHDNCSLHAGLNPFNFKRYKGEGMIQLMTDRSVSTFKNFPISKARHVILTNEKGKIIEDGIVLRRSQDEFMGMWVPSLEKFADEYGVTVEDVSTKQAFFQLVGPRSLEIVEDLIKADLHDLKFMYAKDVKIDGKDAFILRAGMGGTLGYEVHCSMDYAMDIYKLILEVGEPYGITEIGRHAYRNTHTEGKFPQGGMHFPGAMGLREKSRVVGSLSNDSERKDLSPIDVGWEKMISFDHDFPGKEALKAEMERPHNTMVNLRWDPEDILKVIATYFEEDSCDIMDMVEDYDPVLGNYSQHMDEVYVGDKMIGVASGRMWSPKFHEMMSMGFIEEKYAAEGTVVKVLWGTPGTRQMRIKAEVIRKNYITKLRNDAEDTVDFIPRRYKK